MTWNESKTLMNIGKEISKETEQENIMQYMRLMGVVKWMKIIVSCKTTKKNTLREWWDENCKLHRWKPWLH